MALQKFSSTSIVGLFLLFLVDQSSSQIIMQALDSLGQFLRDGQNQILNEPEDQKNIFKEYDFIIVGAGTAGCTLANRLTEVNKWRVLLIEAGDRENLIMDIPMLANLIQFTKANWKYKTMPSNTACLGLEKRSCNWPRGKVMGGSSVLNYMMYTRGNKRDYDRWAQMGNEGWGWEDILPYYKKIENMKIPDLSSDPEYHGYNGYLHISYSPFKTNMADAWLKSSVEAGHKLVDYNGKTQTGASLFQFTLSNGTRHSANSAYLMPINGRKNLHVIKNTMVTKILIDENKRAIGVEFSRANKKYRVFARKEVIVSAGAINSPQLLMLSGIGPQEDLASMGIPVIQNSMVGYNLMDHIGAGGLTFTVDRQNVKLSSRFFYENPEYIFDWMKSRGGPLSVPGGCETVTFVDSNNPTAVDGWPDIELLLVSGSLNADESYRRSFGFADKIFDQVYTKLGDTQSFMISPIVLRPLSRGRIMLKNTNPFSYPLIYPNYYTHQQDVDTMVAAIKAAINITQQPSFQKMNAKLYDVPIAACEKFGFGTDLYWECHSRFFTFTIYHQSGTCKMGPRGDPTAVVDPTLRVYGVTGLRVVDASIIPEIPSAHTNAPTYMIAEKAADMIKEEWGIPEQRYQ